VFQCLADVTSASGESLCDTRTLKQRYAISCTFESMHPYFCSLLYVAQYKRSGCKPRQADRQMSIRSRLRVTFVSLLCLRFPNLTTEIDTTVFASVANKAFMKEVHDLLTKRQATMESAYFARHGYMLSYEDFIAIKVSCKSLLNCLTMSRSVLRKKLFGEEFWRDRELQLRLSEGHRLQDPRRRNSAALVCA
jgi:hypothetical protein